MMNNENGRPDVAASERPAEQISITPSSKCPRGHYNAVFINRQGHCFLSQEAQNYVVRRQLTDYLRPGIEDKPLRQRLRLYEEGKRELDSLGVCSEVYVMPDKGTPWNYEDERRLVDYVLQPFNRDSFRALPKAGRDRKYNEGMREINSYVMSADSNEYARIELARMLNL